MLVLRGLVVLAGLFWLAAEAPVRAETRAALVIGINEYQNVPKLEKAVADAQAMANELKTLGFEVTPLINPTRRNIYAALSAITGKLQPGDTMLLHYSGHGVQIDGENYLLPADIPSTDSGDKEFLKSEAIALSAFTDRFRNAGVRVQILVIDACRDNPFASGGKRSIGATRGLGPPVAPPRGSFILFSASPGQSALDQLDDNDRDPNSPFTRMLLKKMRVPGLALTDLARQMRDEVEAAASRVAHEQRPSYADELTGAPFYFTAPGAAAALPQPAPELPGPARDMAAELAFWDYIKGANSAALFDVYLEKYGDTGQFSGIARIESARLKRQATAAAPQPPPKIDPAPPAPSAGPPRPAFDCTAARTNVEMAICGNSGLADKDRELVGAYRQLIASTAGTDLTSLQDSQRNWRTQRDTCNNLPAGDYLNACIGRAYDTRIAQLRRFAAGGSVPAQSAPAPAAPPSFDCRFAKTTTERQICADPELAAKDRLLAGQFGVTLASLNGGQRDAVIADQLNWLRQRETCAYVPATMTMCISAAYDRRMAGLRGGR